MKIGEDIHTLMDRVTDLYTFDEIIVELERIAEDEAIRAEREGYKDQFKYFKKAVDKFGMLGIFLEDLAEKYNL